MRLAAASAAGTRLVEGDVAIAANAETFFEAEAAAEYWKQFDIFLSHADADKAVAAGLYAILRSTGFTVYVDWIHDRHRLNRSQATADIFISTNG